MATEVVIGWGTFRGKCERYAKTIAASIGVTAQPLKQIDPARLVNAGVFIACLSTCGNGAHTPDAGPFITGLSSSHLDLSKLKVAVLGLGSTYYPKFCKAGSDLYAALVSKGAKPLVPFARSDLKSPDLGVGVVVEFQMKVRNALRKMGFQPKVPVEFAFAPAGGDIPVAAPHGFQWVDLKQRERLSGEGYSPALWRFVFATTAYKAGNHSIVLPRNEDAVVKAVLEKQGVDPAATVVVKDDALATLLPQLVTAWDLFAQYVDLSQAVPEPLKRFGTQGSVGALLAEVAVPLQEVLVDLPMMDPRTYSIASAGGDLELVIAEVFDGEVRRMTSTFWAELDKGKVAMKFAEGMFSFDPGKNLIMVALGSGIAAILSVLHAWVLNGRTQRAMLVYGERYHASAPVLADKLKSLEKLEVFYAISREAAREHVNEVLVREKARVVELWNESSQFYYCGNPAGWQSTRATLVQILQEAGKEEMFDRVKQHVEAY